MSYNLPPGVTDADIDREMGGECTTEESRALNTLYRGHRAYEAALKAAAAQLTKHRILPTQSEIGSVAQCIGEAIVSDPEIHDAWEFIKGTTHDESYTPSDDEKIIAAVYESLVDSLRLKPIDKVAVLRDILRPIPTNPATHAQTGEAL